MILDNEVNIAHQQAFGTAAGTELDLEAVGAGKGEPLKLFIQGVGLTGATGYTIESGLTTATYVATDKITVLVPLVDNIVEFELPSNINRFVLITVTGTLSAGTWSAGVTLPGNQTAV